jgi:superfamily I DNA/RNA helicase
MGVTLPEPQGQQREVVYLRQEGHCVVLGSAGSGKTVMAVHRARYLSKAPVFGGPTLLVTFNGALVTYLKSLTNLDSAVAVEQYHLFAKRYLEDHTGTVQRICPNELRRELVIRAIEELRSYSSNKRSILNRPASFFLDEFDWIAGQGISDINAYASGHLNRLGRGTALTAPDRAIVCKVLQRYQKLRSTRHYDMDWSSLAPKLRNALESGGIPRQYQHIVVDEGQDFSPEMIRSLAAAVPKDGSLTFFGDYAQQIYGRRMSWRSLGLRIAGDKVVRFDRNYRNTRQIARLASAIAALPFFPDGVDLVHPKEPINEGEKPTLVLSRSKLEQIEQATRFASNLVIDRRTRVANLRIAILVRTEEFNEQLDKKLKGARKVTRLHKGMRKWVPGPGIFYGPYAEARGMEFDAVILPICDEDALPTAENIKAFGRDEATLRQARELYIAVTRARTELVILHSGQLSSLLPDRNSGLYEELDSWTMY